MQLRRVRTPHGVVAVAELEGAALDAALADLADAERAHAAGLAEVRRRDFVRGRVALHGLLEELPLLAGPPPPILSNDRGAPALPEGWVGSISHKGAFAAAIVAPADVGFVGVDLELAAPPRADIARRILTPREQAALPDRGRAVTLRFAIKEAIYKAIDPVLRRYVGFTEVELDVHAGGACTVTSALPLAIDAAWCEYEGHWIATAQASRRSTSPSGR
ncbi:MAG: 4'-phosphopantetheinyl transferase superfamily protein [Deltaproteobacteria bacterium]|nr:4'-phosphopantetheinyl transferase superfamily protein [Deltaproteobacteria bacterium]